MNQQKSLERVQGLFSSWRAERKPRQRIPDQLWAEALELSKSFGVTRMCQTLRLNQGTFKRYREEVEGSPNASSSTQDFLELPKSPITPSPFRAEISLEFSKDRRVSIRLEDTDIETASRFLHLLMNDS